MNLYVVPSVAFELLYVFVIVGLTRRDLICGTPLEKVVSLSVDAG
jgi:hypothetical protein